MDQEILTNVIMNSVETQNIPGPSVFPGDANLPYIDLSGEDSDDLSIWSPGGPSSIRHPRHPLEVRHEGTKMEHGWASSLTINGTQGSNIEERQLEQTTLFSGLRVEGRREATSMLPLENGNLNLNSTPVDGAQSFSQDSNFLHNSEHNSHVSRSSLVLEAEHFLSPFIPASSGFVQIPSSGASSNLSGGFPGGANFSAERGEGTSGNTFNGRRLSCKRKSIEGEIAQSSASGSSSRLFQDEDGSSYSTPAHQSSNFALGISSSSNNPLGAYPPAEHLISRIRSTSNLGASDHDTYNITGRAEGSQRNCRIRINPAQHVSSPNPWPLGNHHISSSPWYAHHTSYPFASVNQSQESRLAVDGGTSDSQTPVLPLPAYVQSTSSFAVNVASSSRTGSISRSPGETSNASREETNSRNLSRNYILERSVLPHPADIRHMMQNSSSWSLDPTSEVGTNLYTSSEPAHIPHQNPPTQYQRRLPVVARRSLVPSVSTGSTRNVLPQPSGPSNNLQEERNQNAAALRLQQAYMRSTNGVMGDLSSLRSLAAARDSRSRVLSEHIRNALARRREHMQLEGVFLLDPAVLYERAADLQDRHRDMRLDVDNMSYEELLALTERIGNVSTGLNEDTILKHLKQRKYISLPEEMPCEVEPCCICQEEYLEEDDIGRLDCGHDFHTACIKQWLTMKNLCPICKTTGIDITKGG